MSRIHLRTNTINISCNKDDKVGLELIAQVLGIKQPVLNHEAELEKVIRDKYKTDGKIPAIKLYKEIKEVGLKEAKDGVEQICSDLEENKNLKQQIDILKTKVGF